MTKLVRKLKQLAKRRAHRKSVQKRKAERAQREIEEEQRQRQEELELETDFEMERLVQGNSSSTTGGIDTGKKASRIVGGLVLETPKRKAKKQLTRRQIKRKEEARERGMAVAAQLGRKWETKKRRVRQRAQIRNEDLHD
ncbi:hypothetical protein ERJ75_000777200 [Trypanosoma vivax]|uniref:Uncharacterized protein n=1 Tax=Trypanosoma vivax (strain Y486) TaxID=1055687 RepID=G0U3F3_TRYVY|nr:hypothetical protein TRVL_00528 [Trypanosoma vivax]KAH8614147.1 hypothetical protein ERJ75_000777200 [Trypanosoma vivax]CCC50810.1 conserved hypothetical protein [Trypanosoma vivax Y486]